LFKIISELQTGRVDQCETAGEEEREEKEKEEE